MNRSRLASVFQVQAGEGKLVSLLALHYFFLGAASVFTQSIVFAMFLTEFGTQNLPYMYLATPLAASAVAYLYLKLGEHISISRLLVVNLASLTLVTFLLRLALIGPASRALLFFLPIWFQILANMTILAVWSLAGRLLDVRQGKRLYGLVGAGNWAAIAAGGFVVSPIISLFGSSNLLLLAGFSLMIGVVFQVILIQTYRERLQPVAASNLPLKQRQPKRAESSFKSRYVLLILTLVIVWWVGFFFIDNIFYDRTVVQFPDPSQLAGVLGNVYAVDGVLGLIITTFLSGPLMNRLGVRNSLLVLPLLLMACFGALALTGSLAGAVTALFWLAAFGKVSNISVGFTLDQTAHNILYQPLASDQRVRVQTLADGVIQPIGIGVAGLLLLIFNTTLHFTATQLSILFVIVGLVWVGVVMALRKEYPAALAKALSRRRLSETPLSFSDQTSLDVLRQGLSSPSPNVVLYALDLLEQADQGIYTDALPGLLKHPIPEIRLEALRRIESAGLSTTIPDVRQSLQSDLDAQVRGMALRVLAELGGIECQEEVVAHLEDALPDIRREAMVGLLRSGLPESTGLVHQAVHNLLVSADPAQRIVAARVICEARETALSNGLAGLFQDGDPRVRAAALRAAGELRDNRLWPAVIEAITLPKTSQAGCNALVAGGESVLPEIEAALDRFAKNPAAQVRLIQACSRIGGPAAISILKKRVETPDAKVRSSVLSGLSRNGYQARGAEAIEIQNQIRDETRLAAWLLGSLVDLGEAGELELLREALLGALDECRDRILLLLSFIYESEDVLQARTHLASPDPSKQAYAIETLDVLLSHETKALVFSLLEPLEEKQRLRRLTTIFPQPHFGVLERLQVVREANEPFDGWIKACAEDALARLSGLNHGVSGMLTTVEKVLILKSVSIFANTPGETLAEVAGVCDELEAEEGETIFEKGDVGDSLYIIISGRVRVHDGENTLNYLTDRDVFGEMALLDPEPRMASITPSEHTYLLRLDREAFFELLDEQPQIARGIIQVLSHRLRERIRDLDELRAKENLIKSQ